MSYRRRYPKRGRSSSSFGGAVGDIAYIANRCSPRGALIVGFSGFAVFYFIIPWLLAVWANHQKAKMTGQLAGVMSQFIDELFLRRFIHPSELAGIAMLLVGIGVAVWKACTYTSLNRDGEVRIGWFARILARILD